MDLAKKHCGLHDVMLQGVYDNPFLLVKVAELIQAPKALKSHLEDPDGFN